MPSESQEALRVAEFLLLARFCNSAFESLRILSSSSRRESMSLARSNKSEQVALLPISSPRSLASSSPGSAFRRLASGRIEVNYPEPLESGG